MIPREVVWVRTVKGRGGRVSEGPNSPLLSLLACDGCTDEVFYLTRNVGEYTPGQVCQIVANGKLIPRPTGPLRLLLGGGGGP